MMPLYFTIKGIIKPALNYESVMLSHYTHQVESTNAVIYSGKITVNVAPSPSLLLA
jgi:hypothetical protein